MERMAEHCAQRIWKDGWGQYCSRRGITEENDQWWCRQHAPTAVTERYRRRFAQRDRELAASRVAAERKALEWKILAPIQLEVLRAAAAAESPIQYLVEHWMQRLMA